GCRRATTMRCVTRWRLGMLAVVSTCVLATLAWAGAAQPPPTPPPHPVVAWPAGPFEGHIAFDQPPAATAAKACVGRVIPFEEEESVIEQAKAKSKRKPRPSRLVTTLAHRGMLRIVAARLADEGRTLVLTTDPQPRVATYSLHLTGIRAPGQPPPGES